MKLSEWIEAHARGDLDEEAGAALVDVSEAVAMHNKPGSVTLTIKVDKNGRMLDTSAEVKAKAPKAAPESSMWFLGEDGLDRQDPLDAGVFAPERAHKVGDDGKVVNVETGEISD